MLSRTKLEEFLTGPPFEVELHDRDRRADIIKPLPKIFDIHGNEEHLFDTSGKLKLSQLFKSNSSPTFPSKHMSVSCRNSGYSFDLNDFR